MVAELDTLGLDVVETQSFATDVKEALEKLKEKDVRIILGNFNEYWARKVFCEAFRQVLKVEKVSRMPLTTASSLKSFF